MATLPKVQITQLEKAPEGSIAPLRLGDTEMAHILGVMSAAILQRRSARATAIYLLEWEGTKTPRGAVVSGKEIAWTQHGCVISENSEDFATYERLVDFGGTTGQSQKMLVFVK